MILTALRLFYHLYYTLMNIVHVRRNLYVCVYYH